MNRFPYKINVRWSEVDESYLASVPAIAHCIAYGNTPAEAVAEVTTAAEAVMESHAKHGTPCPAADWFE